MKRAFLLSLCVGVIGCAAPQQRGGDRYNEMPSAALWLEQVTTASPMALAQVEAELGRRGETHSGSAYLGKQTSSAYGRQLYARASVPRQAGKAQAGKDCADFASAGAAQQFFLSNGGPTQDAYNLDGDGDGLACEWGRDLKANSQKYGYSAPRVAKSTPKVYAKPRYSSGCYVGPRGGRYTITASGRKNYGGC